MDGNYPNSAENATELFRSEVSLTVLVSASGPLTKRFRATPDGKVERVAGSLALTAGEALSTAFNATSADDALSKVKGAFAKFQPNYAVMTGLPPTGRSKWTITTSGQEDVAAGTISRSKDYFSTVEGPALFALDFDVKEYPEAIKSRIDANGGLEAVIASVCPALGSAAHLITPSASSYIRNTSTGFSTGRAGEHWYFILSDGRETIRLAETIAERLEAAGWCWGHVSKSGAVKIKTLIDTDATDPARILYEAPPVLGEGLEPAPEKAAWLISGGVLRSSDFAPLTDSEAEAKRTVRLNAKADVSDQAERVRHAWRQEREACLIESGVSPDRAARVAATAAGGELMGDFEIQFDDGTSATVREILRNPDEYAGKTGPDPVEPEYGGGRNLAVLQMGYPPRVYSQAHGGIAYALSLDPSDFFEVVKIEGPSSMGAAVADRPKAKRGFQLLSLDDIQDRDPEYIVADMIETDCLAQIFGDPENGKTFLAIDLAASVASGRSFHERAVRQGPVVYVAGEGRNGLKRRFRAWAKERGESLKGVPLSLSNGPASLSEPTAVAAVAASLAAYAAQHGPIRMIVIDTLARNFGSGDENDTRDMNRFVAALDKLREPYPGCTVLIVHHSGHGDKGRARGAMALRGALDAEYRVDKVAESLTVTNTKMKEGPRPAPMYFRMKPVDLGTSNDGRPIESVVLEPAAAPHKLVVEKLSPNLKKGLQSFRAAMDESGPDDPGGLVHLERWREAFYAVHTGDNLGAKKKAFQRAREELVDRGYLSAVDDLYSKGAKAWPA